MNNPFAQRLIDRDSFEFEPNGRYEKVKRMPVYYKCIKCNGTGLSNYSTKADFTFWDGHSTCKVCDGKGVFDFIENLTCGVETEEVKNNG